MSREGRGRLGFRKCVGLELDLKAMFRFGGSRKIGIFAVMHRLREVEMVLSLCLCPVVPPSERLRLRKRLLLSLTVCFSGEASPIL